MIRWSKLNGYLILFFLLASPSSHGQGFTINEMEMLLAPNFEKFEEHVINRGYLYSEERSDSDWSYFVDTLTAMLPRPNHLIRETSTGTLIFTTVDEEIYAVFQKSLVEAGYIIVAEDSAEAFSETLKTQEYTSLTGKYYCVLAQRSNDDFYWYNIRLAYSYHRD